MPDIYRDIYSDTYGTGLATVEIGAIQWLTPPPAQTVALVSIQSTESLGVVAAGVIKAGASRRLVAWRVETRLTTTARELAGV